MDLLLDTHAFIWFVAGADELPGRLLDMISSRDNRCYVSVASIWEMSIKISLGKLEWSGDFSEIRSVMADNAFDVLPVTVDHVTAVATLAFQHRDPFDRLIIAQAQIERLPIVTKDLAFGQYDVEVIW